MKTIKMIYLTLSTLAVYALLFSGILAVVNYPPVQDDALRAGVSITALTVLGALKIITGVLILLPPLKFIKYWAYSMAGLELLTTLFFYLAAHDAPKAIAPALIMVLFASTVLVYYKIRLEERKPVETALFI